MHIDIPDPEAWAAVGTVALISATSLIKFIRWQKDVLTKKEHDKLCLVQQQATTTALASITNALKQQDRDSSAWRSKFDEKMDTNHTENRTAIGSVKDQVAGLRTDVEVLKTRVNQLQPSTTVNIQG